MSSILVSGSHGFIGSHLVSTLEKRGDTVIPLKRDLLINSAHLQVHTDEDKPDYIFHLAAYGNMATQRDLDTTFLTNLFGTHNLLKATKELPYKAFINVSSSSVQLPHQTMYSATKLGAEALCKAFVDEYNKPIVSVRPFSVYGPGEADFRFIPTVFRSCLTGEPMDLAPDATHDWVYVQDFVQAMLEIATDIENQKGTAINIGTGKALSNEFIVMLIEQITEKKANIKKKTAMRSFDNHRWKAKISDYLCSTQIKEGLEKYYESIE